MADKVDITLVPLSALEASLAARGPAAFSGLSLQVTDACNLACSYCYFYKKEPVTMSRDVVDRSLDLLDSQSLATVDEWHVNLFGGEPTLHPDLIRYICTEATRRAAEVGRGVSFSMTTNGTRFSADILDLTREFAIGTMLSIDGNREAHDQFRRYLDGRGSYDKILENLPRLKSAPQFKARLTVSPMTVHLLSESVEELLGLGINRIATSPVVEEDWTPAVLETFAQQWQRVAALYVRARLAGQSVSIKGLDGPDTADPLEICKAPSADQFGCGAATRFVFVNAFGDLYPCHRYPGYFDKSPDVRLGSVFTGVDEARRQKYVHANLASSKKGCDSFVSSAKTHGRCADCAIQGPCGGSCMAVNEYLTGDPAQPTAAPGAIEQIKLVVRQQVHDYLSGSSPDVRPKVTSDAGSSGADV